MGEEVGVVIAHLFCLEGCVPLKVCSAAWYYHSLSQASLPPPLLVRRFLNNGSAAMGQGLFEQAQHLDHRQNHHARDVTPARHNIDLTISEAVNSAVAARADDPFSHIARHMASRAARAGCIR